MAPTAMKTMLTPIPMPFDLFAVLEGSPGGWNLARRQAQLPALPLESRDPGIVLRAVDGHWGPSTARPPERNQAVVTVGSE